MASKESVHSRAANRLLILNQIRQTGAISRVALAERTGCSRSTVTNITAELLAQSIIIEKGIKPAEGKGRRRMLLALNPDAAFVVGVKVMSMHVTMALTDFQASVRNSLSIPVRAKERPLSYLADTIEDGIRHCVKEARLDLGVLSGIGLAIPGFVDHETGRCFWTPLYNTSGDVSLTHLVQERLGIPVFIENDANAMALSEQWFGHGQGEDNFIVITVEQGIGMGAVLHGKLYRGARGIGPEFGHIVVDREGPQCRCGKRGCIEAYAGGSGVMRTVLEAYEKGEWEHPNIDMLTVEEIIERAHDGDVFLRDLFHKGGEVLGAGVAAMVQMLNPTKILITGQYANAGDLLFAPMRREVLDRVSEDFGKGLNIEVLHWKDTDWARGAASVVLQNIYKSPETFLNKDTE